MSIWRVSSLLCLLCVGDSGGRRCPCFQLGGEEPVVLCHLGQNVEADVIHGVDGRRVEQDLAF